MPTVVVFDPVVAAVSFTSTGGPCGCCATTCAACDPPPPHTLYVTFTGGDCRCLLTGSSYELTYRGGGVWSYTEDPSCDEFGGYTAGGVHTPGLTIGFACAGGNLALGVEWASDSIGTPYRCGFTFSNEAIGGGNACDPFSVTFDAAGFPMACNNGTGSPTPPCFTVPTSATVTE